MSGSAARPVPLDNTYDACVGHGRSPTPSSLPSAVASPSFSPSCPDLFWIGYGTAPCGKEIKPTAVYSVAVSRCRQMYRTFESLPICWSGVVLSWFALIITVTLLYETGL